MSREEYEKALKKNAGKVRRKIKDVYESGELGHTLERHLNMTDEQMLSRAKKEGHAVSSFYGDVTVLSSVIYHFLISSEEEINEFVSDDGYTAGDSYELIGTMTDPRMGQSKVAYCLFGQLDQISDAGKEYCVVLKKVFQGGTPSFRVVTAYPDF